jgi:hypothetical protein
VPAGANRSSAWRYAGTIEDQLDEVCRAVHRRDDRPQLVERNLRGYDAGVLDLLLVGDFSGLDRQTGPKECIILRQPVMSYGCTMR